MKLRGVIFKTGGKSSISVTADILNNDTDDKCSSYIFAIIVNISE